MINLIVNLKRSFTPNEEVRKFQGFEKVKSERRKNLKRWRENETRILGVFFFGEKESRCNQSKKFALIKGESRFSPVQHNNHTLFSYKGSPWEDNPQRDFPL